MKMNNFKKLLTATVITGAVSMAANAADTQIQTYANPTLFGTQANSYATTAANYVVGGEVAKTTKTAIAGKPNVLVASMADDVLDVVKNASASADWDTKMPVLRSELAVILAESFASGRETANRKAYTDVEKGYWAESWIETAQDTGLMIGYPDNKFRPDQRVTKAEVFATIAQIVDVDITNISSVEYNNQELQYIPLWSVNATKEVIGSNLLNTVPDQKKLVEDEYLSKEQVAYLISALKTALASGKANLDPNAPQVCKDFANATIAMKMNSRVSAKHSNVNELFTAKTTKAVTVKGETFPAGSTVTGRVVEVKRPGLNHPGYIKVQFENIKNGKVKVDFPNNKVGSAEVCVAKDPNVVARVFGAPFSAAGRVVGVAGRSGALAINVAADRVEELGDDTSDLFVEPMTGHLGSGVKSASNGLVAVGKGVVDIAKTAASGTFGIVNEVADELVYLVYPKASNNAALNPNEEIIVSF